MQRTRPEGTSVLRRLLFLALLFAVLAGPLVLPLLGLLADPSAWGVWGEGPRLLTLLGNTLLLLAGTLALALPAGTALAFLIYRTDLPGRGLFRTAVLLTLFVPLPLFASAWQAVLGGGGLAPLRPWNLLRPDAPTGGPGGVAQPPGGHGAGSARPGH